MPIISNLMKDAHHYTVLSTNFKALHNSKKRYSRYIDNRNVQHPVKQEPRQRYLLLYTELYVSESNVTSVSYTHLDVYKRQVNVSTETKIDCGFSISVVNFVL